MVPKECRQGLETRIKFQNVNFAPMYHFLYLADDHKPGKTIFVFRELACFTNIMVSPLVSFLLWKKGIFYNEMRHVCRQNKYEYVLNFSEG